VGPKLRLLDGIQAARWLLQRDVRFHTRCEALSGIEALKQYHYEFDEKRKVYTNRPAHDWSSHTADALRYLACVIRVSDHMIKPRGEARAKPKPIAVSADKSFTLDDLFEAREASLPDRQRIA
jgi:hypothetical protein